MWNATLWSLAAGVLLVAALWWVERRHDSDLGDVRSFVTAAWRDAPGSSADGDEEATALPIAFREEAAARGIEMMHGAGPRGRALPEDMGSGLAWGDFDDDGWQDLFVVNMPGPWYGPHDATATPRLFRNVGGRFEDVTEAAGLADSGGFGMGARWVDYDGDGRLDLHVTHFGPDRLYWNRGDGTFEDRAGLAGVADPAWSTGAAWGDYDRDGHLDFYLCHFVRFDITREEAAALAALASGPMGLPFLLNPNSFDPVPNRLMRGRGDGTFEDVTEEAGVGDPEGRSLSAAFVDLDGDGWLDLYVCNDVSANRFFLNLGRDLEDDEDRATFVDQSLVAGVADPRGAMGLSVADVGGRDDAPDGLPDLFITHWVAQENALFVSHPVPGGMEYRDRANGWRLGEPSLDAVGWGCGFADLDLDGRLDLLVANGSTLEDAGDASRLQEQPLFLFHGEEKSYRQVPVVGEGIPARANGRGLALADFDNDGRTDAAVSTNRGRVLLLRNVSPSRGAALRVELRGPAAVVLGARVEVDHGTARTTLWEGADMSYLSGHAPGWTLGLHSPGDAHRIVVTWADGRQSAREGIGPGRIVVSPDAPHEGASPEGADAARPR